MTRLLAIAVTLAIASCSSSASGPSTGPSTTAEPHAGGGGGDALHGHWLQHQRDGQTGPGLCAADAPDLDKSCSATADCVIVQETLDKCATTAVIGVNARGRAAFQARPKHDYCDGGPCPLCNVRWLFTEDCGEAGDAPIVDCIHGRCLTHGVTAE